MDKNIKKNFLFFNALNKKQLLLTLLFFVIIGLVLPINKALADWWNPFTWGTDIANVIGSAVLKLVGLIFFGVPLFLSAMFLGIIALILGWIISPDFISLKFTQNPFVDVGLSITKGFANMGFILFLVVIALATILRIEEYKAKKTLITLILVALLINFSPVFCGFIIDASNIVMNFFLTGITGLTAFTNSITSSTKQLYNLLIGSGFDFWENVATFMQILISIVFNFFAGFIFILFSALFIMRYIMLWILVILSPIAFVSYILPITRRGQSLLSWRKWWEQLISWSIIGIIAGFFLYLGFTMISMINANPSKFVTYPDLSWGGGGLGLMNNVLPYLIPLVLLWIAYRETKRTSAMFAREIIEMPEKVAKGAVMAAAIAATAGAAAAAGGAIKALPKALPAAVGKLGKGMETWSAKHPTAAKALIVPAVGGWASRKYGAKVKPAIAKVRPRIRAARDRAREWARRHPRVLKVARGAKAAGGALKELLWEKKREPTHKEIEKRTGEIYEKILEGKEPGYTHAEMDIMLAREGLTRDTPEGARYLVDWSRKRARKQLRPKVPFKPIIPTKKAIKTVRDGFKTAWEDWKRRTLKPKKRRKLPREIRERLEAGEITPEEAEWEAGEEE